MQDSALNFKCTTMIRNLILSTMLILTTLDIQAQTIPKHEIQAGAGLYSDEAVIHMLENLVSVLLDGQPRVLSPKLC
jgi:hypothetical protein